VVLGSLEGCHPATLDPFVCFRFPAAWPGVVLVDAGAVMGRRGSARADMFGGELPPPAQSLKGNPMMFPRDPDHALHTALSVLAAARTETRPADIDDERVLPDADLLRWYAAGPLGMLASSNQVGVIVPFPPRESALVASRTSAR
jgi:alkylation response protein AidB-like acyl-CoA dehydrogenase